MTTGQWILESMSYRKREPKPPTWWKLILWIVLCFAIILLASSVLKAEDAIDDNRLADAIYKAENSVKYPYGIKSIDTHGDVVYARKICLNTIRNQKKRHAEHNCGKNYITCLGDRYCPHSAHPLNKNWVNNVKYYYYQKGG